MCQVLKLKDKSFHSQEAKNMAEKQLIIISKFSLTKIFPISNNLLELMAYLKLSFYRLTGNIPRNI